MASTTSESTKEGQVAAEPTKRETPPAGSGEEGEPSTEDAKAEALPGEEGDQHKVPDASGEGEVLAGSISKVPTLEEQAEAPVKEDYLAQCSLCAQNFSGEKDAVTDQLTQHYNAAHIYYNGVAS